MGDILLGKEVERGDMEENKMGLSSEIRLKFGPELSKTELSI